MLYAAVILYRSSSPAADYRTLFEETILLVEAENRNEATSSAERLAQKQTPRFRTVEGHEVSWSFDRVIDVAEVLGDKIGNGTEIYSRHFRDLDAYQRFETLA